MKGGEEVESRQYERKSAKGLDDVANHLLRCVQPLGEFSQPYVPQRMSFVNLKLIFFKGQSTVVSERSLECARHGWLLLRTQYSDCRDLPRTRGALAACWSWVSCVNGSSEREGRSQRTRKLRTFCWPLRSWRYSAIVSRCIDWAKTATSSSQSLASWACKKRKRWQSQPLKTPDPSPSRCWWRHSDGTTFKHSKPSTSWSAKALCGLTSRARANTASGSRAYSQIEKKLRSVTKFVKSFELNILFVID